MHKDLIKHYLYECLTHQCVEIVEIFSNLCSYKLFAILCRFTSFYYFLFEYMIYPFYLIE